MWNLAAEHFPRATKMEDGSPARQTAWRAAAPIFGETSGQGIPWVRQQLEQV